MKIAFDASFLVAAFAARGLCADLLEVCLAEHDTLTSEVILEETSDALIRKMRLPPQRAAAISSFLREHLHVADPVAVEKTACRDEKDLAVLGTAVAWDADFLVSGDKDLLTIIEFRGIPILSSRALWERLRIS